MHSQTKVAQWGNSLAIRLPQALVKELAIHKGAELELELEGNGFKVTFPSLPKKYRLEELLSKITPENQHTEQNWGKPEGNEVW